MQENSEGEASNFRRKQWDHQEFYFFRKRTSFITNISNSIEATDYFVYRY